MEKMNGDMLEMVLNSENSRLTERLTKYMIYQVSSSWCMMAVAVLPPSALVNAYAAPPPHSVHPHMLAMHRWMDRVGWGGGGGEVCDILPPPPPPCFFLLPDLNSSSVST